MSSLITNHPLKPETNYPVVFLGGLISSVFTYASYSPLHPLVFKVSLVVGVVFSLLEQIYHHANKETESQERSQVLLAILGCLVPGIMGFNLAVRSIVVSLFSESAVHAVSYRNITCVGGLSLGYTVTNLAFESYYHLRS